MPEYMLPLDSTESHKWADALHPFALGYVEAAFFCTPYHYESGREIFGLGPANMTPEGRAAIEADAVRFLIGNYELIREACEIPGYDMESAGRDLWFSAGGHGVGYWDRGLGDLGDRLHAVARAALPESSLLPEWIGDGDPDPDDSDGWRVHLEYNSDPLTEAERAALAALGGSETAESLPDVACAYGAPLGRRSGALADGEAVTVRRVVLDPGGYDSGGAYWGVGRDLWRVTGRESGESRYVRAADRESAIREARA